MYGKTLHYEADARSVHVLLRVTEKDTGSTADVLIDNLTTAIGFIVEHDLEIWQELIGYAEGPTADQLGGQATDDDVAGLTSGDLGRAASKRIAATALANWREHVSGPGDDALVIDCYGDPALVGQVGEL